MNESTLAGMASSGAGDAATPRDFFLNLDREFRFNIDLAAAPGLTMVPGAFFAADGFHVFDRLVQPHTDGAFGFRWNRHPLADLGDDSEPVVGWLNPPYGPDLTRWLEKASWESYQGATVVALLPARSDTEWWRRQIAPARRVEVRHVKGRIPFGGWGPSGKPIPRDEGGFFPSAVVVFRPPRLAFPVADPEKAARERLREEAARDREEKKEERRRAKFDARNARWEREANDALESERKAAYKVGLQSAARLADLLAIAEALRHVPIPRFRDDREGKVRRALRAAKKTSRRYLARRRLDPAPAPAAGVDPGAVPAETPKEE